MTLGADFKHRALLSKHGNKGDPGYRLLHPGRVAGDTHGLKHEPTAMTPARAAAHREYGAELQAKPGSTELIALVDRAAKDKRLKGKDFDEIVVQAHAALAAHPVPDASPTPAQRLGPRPVKAPKKVAPAIATRNRKAPGLRARVAQDNLADALHIEIKNARNAADLKVVKDKIDAAWKDGKIGAGHNQDLVRAGMDKGRALRSPAKKAPARNLTARLQAMEDLGNAARAARTQTELDRVQNLIDKHPDLRQADRDHLNGVINEAQDGHHNLGKPKSRAGRIVQNVRGYLTLQREIKAGVNGPAMKREIENHPHMGDKYKKELLDLLPKKGVKSRPGKAKPNLAGGQATGKPKAGKQTRAEIADGFQKRLGRAKDIDMVDNIIDQIVANPDLKIEDRDALVPHINGALDRLLPRPMDDSTVVQDAQAAHFSKAKNGIGNAPHPGLWHYVQANRQRFTITVNGDRGVSENFWVKDTGKKPPETWMFKQTHFEDDVLAENMAANIMEQAGFAMPTTKWGTNVDSGNEFMVQRKWDEQHGGEIRNGRGMAQRGVTHVEADRFRKGSDPEGFARLIMYDFLINNSVDRHSGNYLLIEDPDGTYRVGIVDQGLAFWNSEYSVKKGATAKEFYANYRGKNEYQYAANALAVAGSKDELRKHFARVLAGFKKVDGHKIIGDFDDHNLTDSQKARQAEWAAEFERRLAELSRPDGLIDLVDYVTR